MRKWVYGSLRIRTPGVGLKLMEDDVLEVLRRSLNKMRTGGGAEVGFDGSLLVESARYKGASGASLSQRG